MTGVNEFGPLVSLVMISLMDGDAPVPCVTSGTGIGSAGSADEACGAPATPCGALLASPQPPQHRTTASRPRRGNFVMSNALKTSKRIAHYPIMIAKRRHCEFWTGILHRAIS